MPNKTCPLRSFHHGEEAECLGPDCGWWIDELDECGIVTLARNAALEMSALYEEDEEDYIVD